MELDAAVEKAVNECIQEGILIEFLKKNKSEVIAVSIFEYHKEEEEKKLRKAEYEAGKQDGLELGITKEKQEIVKRMLEAGEPIEKIAQYTGYTVQELETLIKSL